MRLSETETAPPESGGTGVIDTKITNYTTDLTDTVARWRSSVVTVASGSSFASGMIFAAEENNVYIFTVAEAAAESGYTVIFDSGASREAETVGSDPETGLLLLRVQPEFDVTPFKTGDSSLLKQGEYIIAMGGRRPTTGTGPVSFGVVSEPGQRKLSVMNTWSANVIETDASVTADSYGGPLMNLGGELTGMLIARPSGAQERMGYAVSVNEMKLVYTELLESGQVVRGSIGAVGRSAGELRTYEKNTLGIPLDTVSGVLITSVSSDSAAEGHLKPGDVIRTLGGEEVEDLDAMRAVLYSRAPEDTLEVTLIRDGEEITESLVLR